MAKARNLYPLSAVRAMALHAQGLSNPISALVRPPQPSPTLDDLEAMIERVVCVQIDTLQMVHRSQYLLLWSRLGQYDPRDLDRLTFGAGAGALSPANAASVASATSAANAAHADSDKATSDRSSSRASAATRAQKDSQGGPQRHPPKHDRHDRRTFEYWLKEACIIPLKDYRYSLADKRWRRDENWAWWQRWLADANNHLVLDNVRERLVAEGGLRASDFESPDHKRTGWWDWKPAKSALEHLYNTGELMIANRVNFQRVYDFTERVLPDWVSTDEPSMDERNRYYLERAVRAHGICQPLQTADYTHTRRSKVKALVAQLISEGVFVNVQAGLADGQTHTLVVHRDDLNTLKRAADGALPAQRTTFLTPFDSLFWGQGRDLQLFNFEQVLECYKPAPIRKWGYFCLPILHRDRVVGRFDPKLERRTSTLRLKALYVEPGIALDEALVAGVAAAMRDFMAFHEAKTLVIERSDPPDFGEKLMKAL
jgi:hypothetical protein